MRSHSAVLSLLLLLTATGLATAQTHVFGTFNAGCTTASSLNQLYDDGLHGDGAANDGVFGADIPVTAPAGEYTWTTEFQPGDFCNPPGGSTFRLWTTGPGDVIHFRATGTDVWAEQDFACDRGMPAGTTLDVLVGHCVLCTPAQCPQCPIDRFPAQHVGSVWERVVTVTDMGHLQYLFMSPDNGVSFGAMYNATIPCDPRVAPQATFTTTEANTNVLFRYDEVTGKVSFSLSGGTLALRRSWGGLKSVYR